MSLPGARRSPVAVEDLTPREIVAELDKHVVAQKDAKRAVAIALRNRWRRQQLDPEIAREILPKNILMIGPTGVGKTEIARRLARLAKAPFLKIEASKFTEVGYVGRDVESMVRDLVEIAIGMVREEKRREVDAESRSRAEDRLLKLLVPGPGPAAPPPTSDGEAPAPPAPEALKETREKFRSKLRAGELDDRRVTVQVEESASPHMEMITPQGVEEVGINLREMMPGLFGRKTEKEMRVADALEVLTQQEVESLIDRQQVAHEACRRVEETGILFLDEIDKVCGKESRGGGPDVSREGVQRDLLPIVEGTAVTTKHGVVHTDHVLFIAAGAFHVSKPSDMMPELQGRFPIRVELRALEQADFVRILTEPRNSLTRQYTQLLSTEGVTLSFADDAIEEIARLAVEVNSTTENIGARRLSTLLERLLDEVSFEAPGMDGVEVRIDVPYVKNALEGIVEDRDLSRYVL